MLKGNERQNEGILNNIYDYKCFSDCVPQQESKPVSDSRYGTADITFQWPKII